MGSGAFGLVWPITKFYVFMFNINQANYVNFPLKRGLFITKDSLTFFFVLEIFRFQLETSEFIYFSGSKNNDDY